MTFSSPTYITIGDEYEKKAMRGKPFLGPPFVISNKSNSNVTSLCGLFTQEILRLSEGEKFFDSESRKHKRQNVTSVKPATSETLHSRPFLYSSPGKKPCGSGTNVGCIGPAIPYETPFNQGSAYTKALISLPNNIYTKPASKGGPGYATRCISQDYKYISYPYIEESQHTQRVTSTKPPFRIPGNTNSYFTRTSQGFSNCHILDRPIQLCRLKQKLAKTKHYADQIWKPVGKQQLFGKPIPYLDDPLEDKETKFRERQEVKPWIPTSYSKSMPTKPVKCTN